MSIYRAGQTTIELPAFLARRRPAVVRAAGQDEHEKLDGIYNVAGENEGLPAAQRERNLTDRTRQLVVEHAWSNPGPLRTSAATPVLPFDPALANGSIQGIV